MYRYLSTRVRLAAWREYAHRDDRPLPPNWFGAMSPATVTRDERGARLHYGEGLGPDIARSRPGFRFVGYADEVVRLNHTGWYGDDEGSGFSVLRGVVYQIPARDGQTLYLAGWEWGENGARGAFSGGGGTIDIGPGCLYETKEDAAYAADSMAESAADDEREYLRNEREREEAEEAERLAAEEAEEAEHERQREEAREGLATAAGALVNATGERGTLAPDSPLRPFVDAMEDAVHAYDAAHSAQSAT